MIDVRLLEKLHASRTTTGGISAVGKIPIRCIIGVAERLGFNIPDKIEADNHTGKTWVTGIDGEAVFSE